MLEEEYAMAVSFLQEQEVDNSCGWESLHRCIVKSMISKLEKRTSGLKTDRNRGREFMAIHRKIDTNWKRRLHKIKFHSIEEEEVCDSPVKIS